MRKPKSKKCFINYAVYTCLFVGISRAIRIFDRLACSIGRVIRKFVILIRRIPGCSAEIWIANDRLWLLRLLIHLILLLLLLLLLTARATEMQSTISRLTMQVCY